MTSERAITIVGGGQAGTLLALGLQTDGWDVRLVQDRAPTDISTGRVMSGQIMFKPALDLEREAGVSFWEDTAPEIKDINVAVCGGVTRKRRSIGPPILSILHGALTSV